MFLRKTGFMSLKWKLFILMAVAFTFVAIGISAATYMFQERQLQRERQFHLERNSRELSAQISRTQQSLIKRLEYINYGVLQSKAQLTTEQYVKGITEQAPNLMLISGMQNISIMDVDGNLLYSNDWSRNEAFIDVTHQAIEKEQPVVSTYCATSCFVYAAIPVLTENQTLSIAASTPLSDVISETYQASGWDVGIYLPTQGGASVDDHWSNHVLALSNHAMLMPRLQQVANAELSAGNQNLIFSANSSIYELVRLPISLSGSANGYWLLVGDVTESYAAIKENTLQLLGVSWCALVLCALWLARLAQPNLTGLGVIPKVMSALAKHDYEEARSNLTKQSKLFTKLYPDELSILAQSATDMAVELERLDLEMEDRNKNLQLSNLELAKQRDFVSGLLDNAQAVIVLQDSAGKCRSINKFGRLLVGKTERECLQSSFEKLFGSLDAPSRVNLEHVCSGHRRLYRHETQMLSCDGIKTTLSWMHSTLLNQDEGNAVLSIGMDITEQKQVQHQLHWLAIHDPLTELLNRSGLQRKLQSSIYLAKQEERTLALLFCDLDHFKRINDAFGHPIGDKLLTMVADNLTTLLNNKGVLSRWGGDEFVVLLDDLRDLSEVQEIAELVQNRLSGVYLLDEKEVFISASVGISVYPDHGQDATTLIKNADVALFKAKQDGRKQIVTYSAEHNAAYEEQISLDTDLRYALIRDELYLHYQPQVCAKTQRIVGAEALLRWNHPRHGFIPPDRFIPLAEESGQIIEIGEWVLKTACQQLQQWQPYVGDDFKLSVNVAGPQLIEPDFLARVRAVVDRTAIIPEQLELEITETFIMTHTESTVAKLSQLKELGITIAIDDFGTGYSSLSYLKSLPIDKLKIDKSFVFDIGRSNDDEEIARAIIALGHSLGLSVLAEGVETQQQADFLSKEKCDLFQGYFFSRPLPVEDCSAYLAKQSQTGKETPVNT